MRDLLEANRPFEVLAWDGTRAVRALASAPFRKPGVHHCFRLTMADGHSIECADHHRVLTYGGWWLISELLPAFGLGHLVSSLGLAQSVHAGDDLSFAGIPSGYRDGCYPRFHPCDALPHRALEAYSASFPSPAGALRHSRLLCNSDDRQPEHTSIAPSDTDRPAISDGLLALAGLSAASLVPNAYKPAPHSFCSRREFSQPGLGFEAHPLSSYEYHSGNCLDNQQAALVVPYRAGNHIISIEYISSAEVYDFEVFGWHNYLAAGMVHHNTYSGAAEMAMHLTGQYPDWWEGRRWDRAIKAWAGGKDSMSVRDSVARLLVGSPNARGTGMIPKTAIVDVSPARGIADGIDTVIVQHRCGETSELTFKSYDQGRERWQAATLDLVWLDEEPDEDIYTEALSRTNATGGCVYMTFTPLLGMSNVVRRFLMEPSKDRSDTNMTIDDAEHISAEQRQRIIDSYPAYEREARTMGVPSLGSGRIFPVTEAQIAIDPFPIPAHWPLIGGIDFGWDHPTAGVKMAWDRDADAVYVIAAHRLREAVPAIHIATLRAWGAEMPWSWPHDGLQHSKDSGEALAAQYRKGGLRMLPERAQYEGDRGSGVEAGLMDMLERMETSRWFVFRNLVDWWDEFRLYHREDGKVVKKYDDLMSASRYALMSLRFAKPFKKTDKPKVVSLHRASGTAWMG